MTNVYLEQYRTAFHGLLFDMDVYDLNLETNSEYIKRKYNELVKLRNKILTTSYPKYENAYHQMKKNYPKYNDDEPADDDFAEIRTEINRIKRSTVDNELRMAEELESGAKSVSIIRPRTAKKTRAKTRKRETGQGTNATMNRISQNIRAVTKQSLGKFGKL